MIAHEASGSYKSNIIHDTLIHLLFSYKDNSLFERGSVCSTPLDNRFLRMLFVDYDLRFLSTSRLGIFILLRFLAKLYLGL